MLNASAFDQLPLPLIHWLFIGILIVARLATSLRPPEFPRAIFIYARITNFLHHTTQVLRQQHNQTLLWRFSR